MTTHDAASPLAGQTVTLATDIITNIGVIPAGTEYTVEDWYDRVTGRSWTAANGNPGAIIYAMRAGFAGLPPDDEVLYGKVGPLGHLVHVSELAATASTIEAS